MKEKRSFLWRWCPQPERIRANRNGMADRSWVPLVASTLILSLLAMQGMQMWVPSAVNVIYPNSYAPFPALEPRPETPAATPLASETTAIVSGDHLTVQFSFPESAEPGKTITISAVTTAKESKKVNSLSIEVFAYVDKQLVREAEATVLENKKIRSGDTWQTTLIVTVPPNAERSTMIGTVTELWEETTSYYSPYYYSWPYYPCYPYDPYDACPPYPYDYTIYYVYEASYVVKEKSSRQTIPLTYVLATTPEYEEISARYKELQQEYDTLVAKHIELSSKYESLRTDYDQIVSNYKQLESNYNLTTLELADYKIFTYALALVSLALGAAVVFLLFQRGRAARPSKKADKQPPGR